MLALKEKIELQTTLEESKKLISRMDNARVFDALNYYSLRLEEEINPTTLDEEFILASCSVRDVQEEIAKQYDLNEKPADGTIYPFLETLTDLQLNGLLRAVAMDGWNFTTPDGEYDLDLLTSYAATYNAKDL